MKNKILKLVLTIIVFGSLAVFMVFSRDFFAVFATMGIIAPIYGFGFYISAIMLGIFIISFIIFWIIVLKNKKLKSKMFLIVLPISLLYVSSILGFSNLTSLNAGAGAGVTPVAGVSAISGATGMSVSTVMVVIVSAVYLAILFLVFTFLLNPIKKVQKAVVTLAKGNIDNEIKINGGEEIKVIEKGLIKISSNLKSNKIMFEKLNNEYSKYLPTQFMKQLGKKSVLELSLGCNIQKEVTTVFIDIKNSTKTSFTLSLSENFSFINRYLGIIGPIVRNSGGFIDKYLGDGVLAVFTDPEVAIIVSGEIMKKIQEDSQNLGLMGIEVKIGIHTGEVVMGVVGDKKRMSATVISDSVNIASYLERVNKKLGTQILFTKDTLDKLGPRTKVNYRYVGTMPLVEGKVESISIFECIDGYDKDILNNLKQTKIYFESAIRSFESGGNRAKDLFKKCLEVEPNDNVAKLYLKKVAKK